MHLLFAYGTLRDPDVQRALFGRLVACENDSLAGFAVDHVEITDPSVVATSGSDRHPILRPGTPDDVVAGSCLRLTADELDAVDRYEVGDYRRVLVTLTSGRRAWVYVSADHAHTLG